MNVQSITPLNTLKAASCSSWKKISGNLSNLSDFTNTAKKLIKEDINGININLRKVADLHNELRLRGEISEEKEGINFVGTFTVKNNILKFLSGSVIFNKDIDDSNNKIELPLQLALAKEEEITKSTFKSNAEFVKIKHKDGTYYKGEVNSNLKPNGFGMMYSKNNKIICDGQFEDGRLSGLVNEYNNKSMRVKWSNFVQGERHGEGVLLALNEQGEMFSTKVQYRKGLIVQNEPILLHHFKGLNEYENLDNIEIKVNGVNKETGFSMFTVFFLENHKHYGCQCIIAINENGNIESSIMKTADGKTFEGLLTEDYSFLKGKIMDENGTTIHLVVTVKFDDGAVYRGTVDANGLPHGKGSVTLPSGSIVTNCEFYNGKYVETASTIKDIINSDRLETYLELVDGEEIPTILFDPITFGLIKDGVYVKNKFTSTVDGKEVENIVNDYFDKKSLNKWLETHNTNPSNNLPLDSKNIHPFSAEYLQEQSDWENKLIDRAAMQAAMQSNFKNPQSGTLEILKEAKTTLFTKQIVDLLCVNSSISELK